MELTAIQAVLARLYTDRAYRRRFLRDPAGEAEAHGLDAYLAQQLAELAKNDGMHFARSLIRKRFGQVKKMLPFTHRLMGKAFWDAFWKFAGHTNPKGVKRHLEDALDFADHLCCAFVDQSPEPAWLVEVLNHEHTWLQAQRSRRFIRIKFFRHDMFTMRNTPPGQPVVYSGRPNLVVWMKLRPEDEPSEFFFYPRWWPKLLATIPSQRT